MAISPVTTTVIGQLGLVMDIFPLLVEIVDSGKKKQVEDSAIFSLSGTSCK